MLGIAGWAHWSLIHAASLRGDVADNRMPFVRDLRELGAHAVLSTASLEMYSVALARQTSQATYLEASARQIVEVDQELAKVDADAKRLDLGPDAVRLEQLRPDLARLKAIERRVGLLTETPGVGLRSEGLYQLLGEMVELGGNIAAQVEEIAVSQSKIAEDENAGLREGDRRAVWTLWTATAVAALTGVLIAFFIGRSLAGAITTVLDRLNAIAAGDLTEAALELDRSDPIASLAHATNRVQASLAEMVAAATETSGSLAAKAASMAQAAERMQERLKQQDQQTLETAIAVRGLSVATAETSQQTQAAAEAAKCAAASAQEGERVASGLQESMQSIAHAIAETRAGMLSLDEDARGLTQVITVLEELSRESNLLALNVSIEASRPCEQRRAAAVAGEAHWLADSAAQATREITAKIAGIQARAACVAGQIEQDQTAAGDGIAATGQMVQMAERLAGTLQHVNQAISRIAAGAAEQADATEKSNAALNSIQGFGKENVREIAETTAAIAALRDTGIALARKAEPFRIAGGAAWSVGNRFPGMVIGDEEEGKSEIQGSFAALRMTNVVLRKSLTADKRDGHAKQFEATK
jgi:methyl-accepting chemotaxis protein